MVGIDYDISIGMHDGQLLLHLVGRCDLLEWLFKPRDLGWSC